MVTASNFLNLQDLLINEIAGDGWIFIFGALVVIFFLAAYFKVSNPVAILLAAVFCLFMAYWFPIIGLIIGLVAGVLVAVKIITKASGG